MTDRLTKFNEETGEYEYRERAKTQEEFNAQRKAVIQRLGEAEDLIEQGVLCEVVRCGQCVHRNSGKMSCVGRRPNWFCPNGERSENGK